MKVIDLQNMNGMTDYALKIGQKLLVNKNPASNVSQQQQQPMVVTSTAVITATPQKTNVVPVTTTKPVGSANVVGAMSTITPIDTSKKQKDTIYHVVEQGETFYSISRQYQVKISDIIAWNKIKEYKLEVGKKLVVDAPEPKATAVGSTSPGTLLVPLPNNNLVVPLPGNAKVNDKYHIVQPKQTLYTISKMYNTTVEKLREWNSLPDNSISIGQKLRIKP